MKKKDILELLSNVPDEKEIDLVVWDGIDSWTAKELKLNDEYGSGTIELEMVLADKCTIHYAKPPTHEMGHSIANSMNDPSPMQEKAFNQDGKDMYQNGKQKN